MLTCTYVHIHTCTDTHRNKKGQNNLLLCLFVPVHFCLLLSLSRFVSLFVLVCSCCCFSRSLFASVCLCLSLFVSVCICLSLSVSVSLCLSLFVVCSALLLFFVISVVYHAHIHICTHSHMHQHLKVKACIYFLFYIFG